MRFLLLLPWCFLLSLALEPCKWMTPEELSKELVADNKPPVRECYQIIKWKWRSDEQATATCFEYFPTTFVEGKQGANVNEIKCTVSQQFECNYLRTHPHVTNENGPKSMFDKCYIFSDQEVTMEHYINNRNTLCPDHGGESGGIPVFLTMTQAKHIAMGAHRKNMFKMWVNVNYLGRTIENSGTFQKDDLLYKELWKVNNDYYWKGDTLVKIDKAEKNATDGKPTDRFLTDAKTADPNEKNLIEYLFFRTRTDYVHNLMQGSFERATKTATASIVCEYRAKTIPEQEKYCKMLQKLGLNAQYEDGTTSPRLNNRQELLARYEGLGGKRRCVYTSLTTYSLDGTVDAIKAFKGCKEKPSKEHSSGLDDGKATASVYRALTKDGSYRLAAIKSNTKIPDAINEDKYTSQVLRHCKNNSPGDYQREHYNIYSHFYKQQFVTLIGTDWNSGFPKDECSDFPTPAMDSKALAINKGGLIDVPVPVRLPALCSIASNVDCALNENLCTQVNGVKRNDLICKDVNSWNKDTESYAICECPKFHVDDKINGVCKWEKQGTNPENSCGMAMKWSYNPEEWMHVPIIGGLDFPSDYDERTVRVVVRNKCKMTVWAHKQYRGPYDPPSSVPNVALMKDLTTGEYDVPNHDVHTLSGWARKMSASSITCTCEPNPPMMT